MAIRPIRCWGSSVTPTYRSDNKPWPNHCEDDAAQLLLVLSDRLTDNIDTLNHVLEKAA